MPIAAHRRAFACLVTLALLAGACSKTTLEVAPEEATTTSAEVTAPATPGEVVPLPQAELPPAEMPTFADDDEAIGVDDAVRTGQLDNGLSYYVRSNDNPGSNAHLRLVVNAGSAMEDDDQLGGAHFLEHMLFNGTEKYPANELITVLESFGQTFGADINAYTTFGETVYTLDVPTNEGDLVDTGLDILHQWATAATLDPEQVELERGVVLAEWRRGQGFWSRYRDDVLDRLLGRTDYANRMPIGTDDSIQTLTPDALRRFYDDWYRPELMSVVAVGDFDAGDLEDRIIDQFSDLTNPAGAPERPDFIVEPAGEPTFMSLSDPESSDTFVELNYPLPLLPHDTIGVVRRDLALDLAFLVLSTRLDEDARRPNAPFYQASGAANPLVREQQSPGLFLYTDPEGAAQSLRDALTEIERGRRFGVTDEELERAITVQRNAVLEAYNARESKQDAAYGDDYVANYLSGFPVASARDTRDLYERLLEEMTVDQVNNTFRASIDSTQPLIIVASPEDGAGVIPTVEEQATILDAIRSGPVEQRDSTGQTIEVLLETPTAVDVVNERNLGSLMGPQGTQTARTITFENGVRVAMIDNQIVSGSVFFQATSPGGWSIEAAEDVVEAQLIPQVVVDSGIADFDQVALDRYLADKTVQVQPYIDELDEGFVGEVATDDLETLFQLMHLYMTEPNAEPAALNTVISGIRPLASDITQNPNLAASQKLVELRYDSDPRYFAVPTVEDLDSFGLERGREIFADHFGDASDFVFVFAGDFDPNDIERLAARYLGTLPSDGEPDTFVDDAPPPPATPVRGEVQAGTEEGAVTLLWEAAANYDETTRMTMNYLEAIIDQRMRVLLREQLSAAYSPFISMTLTEFPESAIETYVYVGSDPARLDEVTNALLANLEDLRLNGPTQSDFDVAREQLTSRFGLVDNGLYMRALLYYTTHPDEDPNEINVRSELVNRISASDVTALANSVLPSDAYVEVRLTPR